MIVVFGGSFNPPTVAHKEMYHFIKKHLDFSEFIYLPTSTKYSKEGLLDNETRYEMLKIMTKDLPLATVSKEEFSDTEYKGTYEYLKNKKDAYFILGSDNLKTITTWLNPVKLISSCKFIVIDRDNFDNEEYINNHELLKEYRDNFIILKGFNMNVSSSLFRKTFDETLVDNNVYKYIKENNLYR